MENRTTVLIVDSIGINPSPAIIGKEYSVEVKIRQEHYYVSSDEGFEFPFSNESLLYRLLEAGKLVVVPKAIDNEMAFVRYKLNEEYVDLTYSPESDTWTGTFVAPSTTSWNEEDHAYGITIWAEDVEGNRVIANRDDPNIGEDLKLRVYDTATILKLESIILNPSPIGIGHEYSVNVVLKQEHRYVFYGDGLEFPFSNESLVNKLIEAGQFVLGPVYESEDNEMAFVRYKLNEEYVDLTYSPESDTWTGTFVAPSTTSWNEEDHAYGITIWAEDVEGNEIVVDRTDEHVGEQLKLSVYDMTTILKVKSVKIDPSPVTVNKSYTVEVKVIQDHRFFFNTEGLEFPLSNESLIDNLIEIGKFLLGPESDIPDNEMAFVRYKLNEEYVDLTYSPESDTWTGTFVAPSTTSWNEEDHAYGITIWAEDVEGNEIVVDRTDETIGDELELRVLDPVPPEIVVVSPSYMAYVTSVRPRFIFGLSDISPGVDPDSIEIFIDGKMISYEMELITDTDGNELFSCISKDRIVNGDHTYMIAVSDYDENRGTTSLIPFIVDTTAGNGETFNISDATFEWFRYSLLITSGVIESDKLDINLITDWMKSRPEVGEHFFRLTAFHDDDEIIYKVQVNVKR